MREKLICVAVHRCNTRPCIHAQPHESNHGNHCGPAMTCYEGRIFSYCVPISDKGEYCEKVRDTCRHCGGRGGTERIVIRVLGENGWKEETR